MSFNDDVSSAPALAATASAAYAAAVTTAMEESSKDDNYDSLSTLIVGRECAGDTVDPAFLVKLTGETDFSMVSSNSDRRQLYPNAEWLPCIVPQEHDTSGS